MKFGFPCFFAIWPGGRRCANCRNAHFLRGTVMKAYSHEKHAKNYGKIKKTKSSDPWARSGERPGWGHRSELFVFFVFPWFFAIWPKPRENQKKSSDPWARSGERPGWGHGSELFVFWFFHGFLQFGQNLKKTKKNKKFRPMGKVWGEAWLGTWGDFFHCFFACFSCEDAFITVALKKCAFLQFAHLRPP